MTWPAVFDGVGALFVGANNDPDVQAERIPGLTWVALKVNGPDASPAAEQEHWVGRMRARGLTVGAWVYAYGPPEQDAAAIDAAAWRPSLAIFDVEQEYKTDAGAPADYPARLVKARGVAPAAEAVTSYGAIPGYGNQPSSIDFAPFAAAGWPILAQIYDGYQPGNETTYRTDSGQPFPGPYLAQGVHRVLRSLTLQPGESVFRPEGLDG